MAARQKEEKLKERIMKEEPLSIDNNNNNNKRRGYVGGDKKRRRRRVCLGAWTERRPSTTRCSFSSRRSSQAR